MYVYTVNIYIYMSMYIYIYIQTYIGIYGIYGIDGIYIYISIVVLSILGWVKSFDTLNEGVTHIHQSQLSFVFTEHRSWLRHMVPGKHCWLTGINRKLSQNQMAHRWDPELQLGLMFIPPNIWQYKIGFHPYPNGSCST